MNDVDFEQSYDMLYVELLNVIYQKSNNKQNDIAKKHWFITQINNWYISSDPPTLFIDYKSVWPLIFTKPYIQYFSYAAPIYRKIDEVPPWCNYQLNIKYFY